MTTPAYPTDEAGRQQLADELTAAGWIPTQTKTRFDRDKIEQFAVLMLNGMFDWYQAGLFPVIMGPGGEVIHGHHRVVVCHLLGIDMTRIPGPRPQIQPVPMNYRPEYEWIDVLPDVA